MGSIMLVAREVPDRLQIALALIGLDDWDVVHINDTARAIHAIKGQARADLVIITANCPGAESYFNVLDAAIRQKDHGLIVLAVTTSNANMAIERHLARGMGATDAVFLPRLVEELPNVLRQHMPEHAVS